jgi:hypothetical protein
MALTPSYFQLAFISCRCNLSGLGQFKGPEASEQVEKYMQVFLQVVLTPLEL